MRKFALFFDGTWNDQKDDTNVWALKELVLCGDGSEQVCYYEEGVGNRFMEKLRGGAFGFGISRNIQDGYEWLGTNYKGAEEVYVFGFSRGAYTARSLVGLIRKCGILKQPSKENVTAAYEIYRDKTVDPDSAKANAFRAANSWPTWDKDLSPNGTRIKFIGVWDTVGALGIPISGIPFSRDYYQFHDTALSKIVDYAYHAVSIDENRKDYEPTLWTEVKPENIEVLQCWFAGAHADVGGGYTDGTLQNIPLRWMQARATAVGLKFSSEAKPIPDAYLGKVHDSFWSFMFGLYGITHFGKRYYRPMLKSGTNTESIDSSVRQRQNNAATKYNPPNLPAA